MSTAAERRAAAALREQANLLDPPPPPPTRVDRVELAERIARVREYITAQNAKMPVVDNDGHVVPQPPTD